MGEGAGKGDTPRPVKKSKYDDTFVKAFGERDPLEYQKGRKIKIFYPKRDSDATLRV